MKKIFFFFSLFFSASAHADFTPSHLFDLYYNWPLPVLEAQVTMEVIQAPSKTSQYYWSHAFGFENPNGTQGNGYMGLQSGSQESVNPSSPYDSTAVIFTIWGGIGFKAYPSDKGNQECHPFNNPSGGDQGSGISCFIRQFSYSDGDEFTFSVKKLAGADATQSVSGTSFTNASVDVWRGSVTDQLTGKTYIIGDIFSDPNYGNIKSSVLFDEYFGSVASCDQIPTAVIQYSNLIGDQSSAFLSHPNFVNKNTFCPNQFNISLLQNSIVAKTSGKLQN